MANRPLFSLNLTRKSNKEKFKGVVAVWPGKFEGTVDISIKDASSLRSFLASPDDYYASAYVNSPAGAKEAARAKAIIREEFGPGSDDDFV